MKNFIISFLAFLLTLSPHSTSLLSINQQITNNTNVAAPKIINAIETRDVAALEAMMCLNIKQNVENLHGKIGDMLDLIEGDITDALWENRGGSYEGHQNDGRTIIQGGISIYITTTTGTYAVGVWWEDANNFAREETGIRNIGLSQTNPLKSLAIISAIEGVGSWHD